MIKITGLTLKLILWERESCKFTIDNAYRHLFVEIILLGITQTPSAVFFDLQNVNY